MTSTRDIEFTRILSLSEVSESKSEASSAWVSLGCEVVEHITPGDRQ